MVMSRRLPQVHYMLISRETLYYVEFKGQLRYESKSKVDTDTAPTRLAMHHPHVVDFASED
jgi:hypothetical protein